MKKAFRHMTLTVAFAIIAGLGLLAYIRLAPSDPAVWHISAVTTAAVAKGPCTDSIETVKGGARAACLASGTSEAVLAELDQIALATPRTTRLAGTPQSGRITWITRTALMGFPDYTTAEATQAPDGTRLDVYARQRFGEVDFGVNAARLAAWLSEMALH